MLRKFLINYIYRYYSLGVNKGKGNILNKIHEKICSSNFITYLIFKVKIDKNINIGDSFPHRFDLTSVLLKVELKKLLHQNHTIKNVLDMGTGRYALLSIFLKINYPLLEVTACDIREDFIKHSNINLKTNNVRVNCITSDLYKSIKTNDFDLVFWNIAYYKEPESYLHSMLDQSYVHLSENGILILGFNCQATKKEDVIALINQNEFDLYKEVNYLWNNHICLFLRKLNR